MIRKFRSSVVLGLSTLVLGSNIVLPIPVVEGATLAKGFQAYSMPDFFGTAHHTIVKPSPKVSVKRPLSPPPTKLSIPDTVMVCKMVEHQVAQKPSMPLLKTSLKPPSLPKHDTTHVIAKRSNAPASFLFHAQTLPRKVSIQAQSPIVTAVTPDSPRAANRPFNVATAIQASKQQAVNMLASGLDGLQTPDSETPKPATAEKKPKRAGRGKRQQSQQQIPIVKMPMAFPFTNNNGANEDVVLQSGISTTVNEVDLTIGKAKVLNLSSGAARISISNPEVASAVVLSPTQIQLIGKQGGVANLLVWGDSNSSKYTVIDINVHRDVSVLSKQIQYLDPGINVIPLAADDSIILTGEAESPETAQLAVELAKAYFAQDSGGGKGGSGAALGGGGAAGGGGSSAGGSTISSLAPGSARPLPNSKVLNLIKVKGEPSTKLELARKKLKEIDPAIRLDIVPGATGAEKAVLTGRVANSAVISRAINTTSVFYGQPGLQVITGPGGNGIRNTGSGNFQTATAFTDNVDINILQGSIITDTSGNVISMMEVAQKPQIRCSVKFLDLSRTTLRQLGATLTGSRKDIAFGSFSGAKSSLAGRTISSNTGSSLITSTATAGSNGIVSAASKAVTETTSLGNTLGAGVTQVLTINQHFQAAISALEEKSKIRSLAEPTLTMLSGEKGSFLAGGEIPVPVAAQNGQIAITFKEFGIRLNLIATLTEDNKIHMQIAPEISTVDPSITISTTTIAIPGFKTRRMQTTLEVSQGESFVLAGLFNQEDAEAFNHFPGIGNLPIIGSFFSARNFSKRDNEMIVIIKPEVVYASSSAN